MYNTLYIPNTALFISLKNSLSKSLVAIFLISVFIEIYSANHGDCLNCSTLCTYKITMFKYILSHLKKKNYFFNYQTVFNGLL